MIFDDLNEIRKSARPSDWWTKYFSHPFSIRLVSLVRDRRVTPNHLTLLSTVLVLLTFPLICWGSYSSVVVAAALLQLGLILDCADGQLARIKRVESTLGEWLDRCTDKMKDFTIIFALSFRYSRISDNAWILGFICFFIVFFIDFLALQAKLSPILPVKEELVDKEERSIIRKLKHFKRKIGFGFFQIGEQYFAYTVFLVFDRIHWSFYFIVAYGSLAIIWFIFNTYREDRLLRKKD